MEFHLGIDARSLVGHLTGIGTYLYEIVRRLSGCRMTLYLAPGRPQIPLPQYTSIRSWRLPRQVALKYAFPKSIRRDGIDIFWAPQTLLPDLPRSIPTVSTIHDLNHMYVPETMSLVTRVAHKLWFDRDVYRANVLVCNSEGTSARVKEIYGLASYIARPGVSEDFFPRSTEEICKVRQEYGLPSEYLLAVGTLEPRKNLERLIEAHKPLYSIGKAPPLVLVGKYGWRTNKAALSGHGVISIGYVTRDLLPAIYSGAAGFLMPSIYEGFGMPVAEARACGCRVLVTDIPELREASGECAVFVDPTVESISNGILQLLEISPPPPARLYTWEAAAETYIRVFRDALA